METETLGTSQESQAHDLRREGLKTKIKPVPGYEALYHLMRGECACIQKATWAGDHFICTLHNSLSGAKRLLYERRGGFTTPLEHITANDITADWYCYATNPPRWDDSRYELLCDFHKYKELPMFVDLPKSIA